MRVLVTGATGLVGRGLVSALTRRGDEVTVLSRDPDAAAAALGVAAQRWDPIAEAAPRSALAGQDGIVHLAGETIAQRWTAESKARIRDSRTIGTENLVNGLALLDGGPRTLVSSSAIGYYGPHGAEPLDEDSPPGADFLAQVCRAWEAAALAAATRAPVRVVTIRTGVVLDRGGGALAKMLPPFRLGIGGPVAGGQQYVSWIHPSDLVGIILAALDREDWSGPVNATAPTPVTNRALSRALGRALHRPSLLPVTATMLNLLYGEMAMLVTAGARVLPAKALVLGYQFAYPELDQALADVLG